MTASDEALFDRDAFVNEIQAMRERLALLSNHWKSAGDDQEAALSRANAWLGNVTNPLTPEEQEKWENGPLKAQAEAEHDDNDLQNWYGLIEASSTDEDRRNDIQYFEEE